MSRSSVSPRVAELARKQTGSDLASSHPQSFEAYCEELKKHLSIYPHDTNFNVAIKPGTNLGVATCLEDGCARRQVKLIERVGVRDGGLATGVGSLSSYRMHIVMSDAHKKGRNARLKTGKPVLQSKTSSLGGPDASPPTPVFRRSALRDAPGPQAETSSSHAGPSRSSSAARQLLARSSGASRSSSASVKAEPVEAVIPRKRTSDNPIRLKKEESIDSIGAPFSTPPAKRVKTELHDNPKTPLRPVNREPSFGDSSSSSANMYDDELDETRRKLTEVHRQIAHVGANLTRLEDKPFKTKGDEARIAGLHAELWRLLELKEGYNAAIPSATSAMHRFGPSAPAHVPAYNMQYQSAPFGPSVSLPPSFQNPAFSQQRYVAVNQALPQVNAPIASGSSIKLEEQNGYAKMEMEPLNLDFQRVTAGLPGMLPALSDDERFDEDGNFYGRGRDTFNGPVAKADDIDKFLISAGNAELFDGNESVDKALRKLNLRELYEPPPGMVIALMPHQVIGVAWMLEKERGPEKGGCLADEMGLGKTVQMIATIAMNPPQDPLRKTTLIVAPLALLDQWQLEIEMKTNRDFKCLIYHGASKPRSVEQLQKYDIVLTTFQTLANEWPDFEDEEKKKKKRKKRKTQNGFIVDDSEEEKPAKRSRRTEGPLVLMEWYRIVLDEAQNIRNRRTRVSRAVSELHSTYRWCLTGTPIINGLADAYGLLRFLRYRPWHDWSEFNGHISRIEKKHPNVATSRLQAIFKAMLFRRKKDSLLDGKRLIDLPNKEIVLHKLEFSQEERDVYKMVEARSQAIFNKFLRAGTVLKNYHEVLVLLLRLRQVCAHPSLIQEEGVATIDDGQENKKNDDLARAERVLGVDFVRRMQAKFRQIMLARIAAEKASAEATLEGDDIECPVCFDSYTDPIITACGHSFCRDCIDNVLNGAHREDAEEQTRYKADERPCPTCRGAISRDMIFSRVSFEPSDEELRGAKAEPLDADGDIKMLQVDAQDVKPSRTVRKRKASARRVLDSDDEEADDGDDDLSDFIVEDDEDEEEKDARRELKRRLKGKRKETIVISDDEDDDMIIGARPDVPAPSGQIKLMSKFLPSTKMKHMMESLKEWAETHPGEKTLIVSQWTGCLQLVSDYLTENQFAHVKYQGNMSRNERDRVVRVFMSKDKATVMLMSLKCGGVGLNLTRANRVISLDLGWSLAIEQQAYDRVHRLGQTREVFVHRLVIADTVEDRILALQERKKGLAEGSLGEGGGKKLGRLSVKELANLFGLDHRGRLLDP